jgi:hypothetical protein
VRHASSPKWKFLSIMIENAILEALLNYKGLVKKPWGIKH